MKKYFTLFAILFLVLTLTVFYNFEVHAAQRKIQYQLGGGGTAGSWYIGSAVISKIFNDEYADYNLTPILGGGESNLKKLAQGKIEFGFSYQDMIAEAYHRQGAFTEKNIEYENLRGVLSLMSLPLHIVVRANSDIYKLEDVLGKRICAGYQGSGYESRFRNLISVIGITPEDIEKAGGKYIYATMNDADTMFKDGLLDVYSIMINVPGARFMEIANHFDIRVLEIDKGTREKFHAKFPGFTDFIIPEGTYNLKEPVTVITPVVAIATHKDVPEEVVYNFTKSVYEQRDRIAEAHVAYKEFDEDIALKGLSVPLHPGAEKYWREIGLIE